MTANLPTKSNRVLEIGITFAITIGFFLLSYWLFWRVGIERAPFDTDEADHANAGLELFTWTTRGSIEGAFEAIRRQAFYPPVHSLFVAASYAFFGTTFAASRFPTLFLFVFFIALLFAGSLRYARATSFAETVPCSLIALLASSIAASSPMVLDNSVLCMLEIPGIAFAGLLLFASTNAPQSGVIPASKLAILGALSALVFFVKYNFGIIVIPGLLAAIFFTPGTKRTFLSRVSETSVAALAALVPIALWVAVTDRPAMLNFFLGHKSYAPMLSGENLFFDIRSWFSVYCSSTLIAAIAAVFAIYGAATQWRLFSARLAALQVAFAWLVLFVSTTNEERHFIIALPFIVFLASLGILQFAARASRAAGRQGATLALACLLFAPLALAWSRQIPALDEKLSPQFEAKPEFNELLQYIASNVDASAPVIVNGVSDDLGIEAIRWMLAQKNHRAYTEIIADSFPYRDDKKRAVRLRMRNIDAPYRIEGFPKRPMSAVLERGYYKSAVQITKLDGEQRFRKEAEDFAKTLSIYTKGSLTLAGRRVEVFALP